jgi:GNAT superfamily N-acetyltransferase
MMHKKRSHRPANQSPDTLEQEAMTNTMECQRGAYTISTDRARLDLDLIHDYLSHSSYWAQGRPFEVVQRSIEHSLCFGVYDGAQQVGFARVVTDRATFAWLCDVFVVESHRGQGLGKWLVECTVAHPELQDLHIFLLATRDAHELYRRYGRFEALPQPERWMARRPN